MRLSDTGMLVESPPKFVRGPKSRVSRSSPCFVKSRVLSSQAWAWCLLMPLMLQVKLVFAKDPSEAIDSVLNKYDHARSHGNHGRAWFGQGQDHGLLRLDVQQERDALKKYLNDALEKRLFAEDNANDQNGRQFKKINERMIPSGDLVNVINELDRNRKKLNLDSSRGVALLNEVQATGESAVEQKMKLNQKFTVTGKAGVNVETKTSSVQEKKPGEKVNKVVTKVKMAENTSSRKRWKTGSRSRPRRDVMGLPSPPPSMSMPGLILAHGYPAEVHHVKTEDGYILELHRIPGPRLLDTSPKKRRRNNRRVGRGRRDAAESYDPNDILVALERERIEGWLQNGNLEVLLQSNDVVKEIIGLDDLHVSETFVRENEEHYKDIPVPSHENEYLFATGFPEKLSRSKRSEAQRNMMQRRQMIQNVHPRALLSMVRRGRSHGSRFRPRPQASGRYPQRSHRRSFQRPRRRSHTPSNLRRTMRDRTMVLPRENSLDLSPSKTRKGLPAGVVSSLDNCNNFTANCANSNLNSGTARAARQITQLRNSKLNENNSNFPDNDFIDGDLNEIDSDHFGKNSSSSEHRNKISKPGIEAKKVVFIQHCLQCSSADFVLNDHNQALAFILADEGYDVWLGNFRGNQYSRGHVSLSPKSIKYWQFTVDDLAQYDLPAMINHVLLKTQSNDLFYIGHSLGTMSFFMASSTNANFLSKIRLMVALAPSGYIDHMRGGLKLMVKGAQTFYGLMETIGIGEVGAVMPWRGGLMRRMCKPESPLAGLCSAFLPVMSGGNTGLHDMEYLPSMLSNLPAGTSFRLMAQIGQIIGANGIRKFDYGVEENLRRYGTRVPPQYKLEKITCPVAIMWSQNDIIVTPQDVAKTVRRLPNVILNYKVPHPTFNHVDFLFADVARELVYDPIVKLFASYL